MSSSSGTDITTLIKTLGADQADTIQVLKQELDRAHEREIVLLDIISDLSGKIPAAPPPPGNKRRVPEPPAPASADVERAARNNAMLAANNCDPCKPVGK